MFKRIMSTLLIGIFALTAAIPAFASEPQAELHFEILYEVISDDYWVQVSEHNGRIYFFRSTHYYTISMDLHLDTQVLTIAYRDKSNYIVLYDTIHLHGDSINPIGIKGLDIVDGILGSLDQLHMLISSEQIKLNNVLEFDVVTTPMI